MVVYYEHNEREVFMWRSKMLLLVAQLESKRRRKITQEEIALATGVRRATISAWMQPDATFQKLDSQVVGAFLSYFQCAESDLYEFEDDPGRPVAVRVA